MIIRYRSIKTVKPSPLSNRGVCSTPGCQQAAAPTLKGAPYVATGHSFNVCKQLPPVVEPFTCGRDALYVGT